MTTGCRLLVMKRSLICALTSVSPATCAGKGRGKQWVTRQLKPIGAICALTFVSPATCRNMRSNSSAGGAAACWSAGPALAGTGHAGKPAGGL